MNRIEGEFTEQNLTLTVSDDERPARIDAWLANNMPDISRATIQKLIADGFVTLGGEPVKGSKSVKPGDVFLVRIPPAEPSGLLPEQMDLNIVCEDSDIIILNKPPGLTIHPAAGHQSGTLVNALLYHCEDLPGIAGTSRPGIVHRLDKNTSGIMVVAKTDRAMLSLTSQFAERKVLKKYLALVHGVPEPKESEIRTEIGRHRTDRKRMSVAPRRGREAVTRYRVVEAFGDNSLVEIEIETGRTHQIRVHMSHIGCPIVGDDVYGSRKSDANFPLEIQRQSLHAWKLGFKHPATGEEKVYCVPLADDIDKLVNYLRNN
ncbi:MAG: RluA family pseudouridine synthase [Lentisphaerae bacterium]|nr:RluA family pseudouridine synthase [Lentisphaerota bacterium]